MSGGRNSTYEDDFAVILMLENVELLIHEQVDVTVLLLATTVSNNRRVYVSKMRAQLSN